MRSRSWCSSTTTNTLLSLWRRPLCDKNPDATHPFAALVLGALALWYVSGLVGDGLLGLVPPPPDPFVQLDMM